jgi:hypothetical protein
MTWIKSVMSEPTLVRSCFHFLDLPAETLEKHRTEILQYISHHKEFVAFRLFWSMISGAQQEDLKTQTFFTVGQYIFAPLALHNIIIPGLGQKWRTTCIMPTLFFPGCSHTFYTSPWEIAAMQYWYLSNHPDHVEEIGNHQDVGTIDYLTIPSSRQVRRIKVINLLVMAL